MLRGVWIVALLSPLCCATACRAKARPPSGGAALFGQVCARCHGPDGTGDPVAKIQLGVPDMTDPAWQARLADDDIRRTVRQGSRSRKMPALGEMFTAAQLDRIVAHVRSLRRAR